MMRRVSTDSIGAQTPDHCFSSSWLFDSHKGGMHTLCGKRMAPTTLAATGSLHPWALFSNRELELSFEGGSPVHVRVGLALLPCASRRLSLGLLGKNGKSMPHRHLRIVTIGAPTASSPCGGAFFKQRDVLKLQCSSKWSARWRGDGTMRSALPPTGLPFAT